MFANVRQPVHFVLGFKAQKLDELSRALARLENVNISLYTLEACHGDLAVRQRVSLGVLR